VAEKDCIATLVAPPPLAAIVIELCALVTVIPEPAVMVAAAGAPADEPMINCPSVANAVIAGMPDVPVVKTPLFAVAKPPTVLADEE